MDKHGLGIDFASECLLGLAVIRYKAVRRVTTSATGIARLRVQAVLFALDGKAPLLCINIYGHVSDPLQRDELIRDVVHRACKSGADYIILGDYNCNPDEGAVAQLTTNNASLLLDDDFQDTGLAPTRDDGHRRLDYTLGNIRPCLRGQRHGPRDHHMVWYAFDFTQTPGLIKPRFGAIDHGTDELDDHCFRRLWRRHERTTTSPTRRTTSTRCGRL